MRFIHASFDLLSLSSLVGASALQLAECMCGICKPKLVIVYYISSHLIEDSLCVYFNFQCLPSVVLTRFIAFNFCACFTSALKLRQNSQGESKEHKLN